MKGFLPVEKVHTFHGESVDTALLVLLYLCLKVFNIYMYLLIINQDTRFD